jgi:hypothetical protein
MPYGFVLLVATVVLAVRHVRSTYASNRSKCLVGGLTAVSILAIYLWPSFLPLAALVPLISLFLQLAVCFYLIFHHAAWGPDDEFANVSRTLARPDVSEKSSVEDH